MPPLPQLAPEPSYEEPIQEPRKAANEDFFEHDTCAEVLSREDIVTLFKKRKITEWMVHNRTDGNSSEIYKNELARILTEMRRYTLSENDYEQYLKDIGEMVD